MFHKILFGGIVLSLVGAGIIFARLSRTDTLFNRYRQYGFVQSDLHYEKVEKSWGEQGLIFYQVEFPGLKVPHHVEKMFLKIDESGIRARLDHVQLDVKQAMKKLYGSSSAKALNDYVPYRDFFDRLLTSLSVMGIDEFMGDILINTTYSDLKTMHFDIQVNQAQKPTIKVSGIIHIPVPKKDVWQRFTTGSLTDLNVRVLDESRLKRYMNYAKSLKVKIPPSFQKGIFSLKNMSQKWPNLSDLMR